MMTDDSSVIIDDDELLFVQHHLSYRKKTGSHVKLSDEQTRALAETPLEMAKTESEKMLLSSAIEKVAAEKTGGGDVAKAKEVHLNQCDLCDFSFKKPSDLIRHMRTHTGEKPYNCDICEKKFTVKSTLKTHMKTHGGGKNLVCHVCQSLFSSKTSLKVHMRLHTGALPYKCNQCDKRFRTPANRKTHVQSVHMKKPPPELGEVEEQPGKAAAEEEMVPLTISAESLAAALDQVSCSGAPLVGATVQLQLHGHGFESALTQLHIDEDLLSQLRKGENINITISKGQLNSEDTASREAAEDTKTAAVAADPMKSSDIFISNLAEDQIVLQEETDPANKQVIVAVKQKGVQYEYEAEAGKGVGQDQCLLLGDMVPDKAAPVAAPGSEDTSILIVPDSGVGDQLLPGLGVGGEYAVASMMDRMDLTQLSQVS